MFFPMRPILWSYQVFRRSLCSKHIRIKRYAVPLLRAIPKVARTTRPRYRVSIPSRYPLHLDRSLHQNIREILPFQRSPARLQCRVWPMSNIQQSICCIDRPHRSDRQGQVVGACAPTKHARPCRIPKALLICRCKTADIRVHQYLPVGFFVHPRRSYRHRRR